MTDFNPSNNPNVDMAAIEQRLSAIKQSVTQLEARLQEDVAAESRGAQPGRRATERSVAEDVGTTSRRTITEEASATDESTASLERNLRARRQNVQAINEQIDAARNAGRLESGFEYGLGDATRKPGASAAAQRSTLLGTSDEAAMQRQARAKTLLADLDGRMVQEQQTVNASLDSDIQKRAMASQGLRRHGALTTEFIDAAAKGNVTMAEMRFQVGATIAKFAGWTAAATAVFAAVGALRELGKGAADTQSGLANLERFTPNLNKDKATEGYVNTARSLAEPIANVAQAQAQFARVFHDQDDSLTAARTSILATKLDQISLADSFRYFTGITQEWGLQAKQLPGIFDQISAAQRRMGARVSELLPALARSSAAIKNTGGDLTQAIALEGVAQVSSGQTGNVVGTAFQRAAANFYRSTASKSVEQSFGLDPNKGFTQFLIDAINKAQTLSGADRTKLAVAIGGKQYGNRIFQSLLNAGPGRTNQALGIVNPQNAAGSAAQEWADKVKGVDVQFQKIGVQIENIGAELARLGAFNIVGGLLIGLNQALSIITDVLQLVNELPGGFRQSVVVIAELYGILRLVQRFRPPTIDRVTGEVTNQGLFRQSAGRYQRRVLGQAADAQVSYYQDRQETLSNRLPDLRLQQQTALTTRDEVVARERQAALQGDANALRQIEVAERQATAVTERVMAAENELTTVTAGLAEARAAQAGIARANTGADAVAAARGAGMLTQPGTRERPTAEAPVPIPGQGSLFEREAATTVIASEEVGVGGRSIGNALTRVRGTLGGLRSGLGSMASSMRNLLTDPFLAPVVALAAGEALKQHFDDVGKQLDALGNEPTSATDAAKRAKFKPPPQPTRYYSYLTPQERAAAGPPDPKASIEARNAQTEQNISNTAALDRLQGKPAPQLFTSQIRAYASKAISDYHKGIISLGQAQDDVDNALKEVDLSRSKLPLRQAARHDILVQRANLGPSVHLSLLDIYKELAGSEKDFNQKLTDNATAVEAFGETEKRLKEPATALKAAIQVGGKNPTGDALKAIKDARDALKSLLQQIDSNLTDSLTLVGGDQAARDAEYARAARKIAETGHGRQQSVALKQLADKRYQDDAAYIDSQTSLANAQDVDPIAGARRSLNAIGEKIQEAIKTYGRNSKEVLDLMASRYALYRQIADEQGALIDANTAIAQAQAGPNDPVGQARAALTGAQQKYAQMKQSGRYKPSELRQQYANVLAAQNDLAQQTLQNAQAIADSQFAVRLSQTDDPVKQAQIKLQQAQRDAAFARTPQDRNNAQAAINDARRGYAQQVQQSRYDDIEFEASIGKLTASAEIQSLQQLERTITGNKNLKRQIQQRIYALKQQMNDTSSLDLDVGNITLPTTYEIRRAVLGRQQGGAVTVHNNQTVQVEVNDPGAADAVFKAIEDTTSTSLAAARRAGGFG